MVLTGHKRKDYVSPLSVRSDADKIKGWVQEYTATHLANLK